MKFKFKMLMCYFTTEDRDAPCGELYFTVTAEDEAEAMKKGINRVLKNPPADYDCVDIFVIKEKTNA